MTEGSELIVKRQRAERETRDEKEKARREAIAQAEKTFHENYIQAQSEGGKVKHTPGPWEQSGTTIVKFGGDGAIICQMTEPSQQYVVGKPLELGSNGWDLQMANAHLITTAPDLLEACENLIGVFDSRARDETELLVIERAVQAIAKAKGEK